MIRVGMDVSKGKSTVCILKPAGEVVGSPYEIQHTAPQLKKLVTDIQAYGGRDDVRVVMEATGVYHQPVLKTLRDQDIFCGAINSLWMKNFRKDGNPRGAKTDAIDAMAIAQYGIEKWHSLQEFKSCEESYARMKALSQQYLFYQRPHTLLTQNLDHIVDMVMPGIKDEFEGFNPVSGKDRLSSFVKAFWHYRHITSMGSKKFDERFAKWAKKEGYHPRSGKSGKIYQLATDGIPALPADESTKQVVLHAVEALESLNSVVTQILSQLRSLAEQRPECSAAIHMTGIGETLAPLLVAEVGDPRNYRNKHSLIAYAGIDVPPYESGKFKSSERHISKKGSKKLRKIGYLIIRSMIKLQPEGDPVFEMYKKKVSEGKPKKVAIVAAMNKLFRVYYARSMETYAAIGQNC